MALSSCEFGSFLAPLYRPRTLRHLHSFPLNISLLLVDILNVWSPNFPLHCKITFLHFFPRAFLSLLSNSVNVTTAFILTFQLLLFFETAFFYPVSLHWRRTGIPLPCKITTWFAFILYYATPVSKFRRNVYAITITVIRTVLFGCFQVEGLNTCTVINVVNRQLVIMSIITGLQDRKTDFLKYNNLLIYHYELIVTVSLECFKFSSTCRWECAVSSDSNQHPTESEVNQTPGLRQVHCGTNIRQCTPFLLFCTCIITLQSLKKQ